jgi:hypothetical protein
MDYTTPPKVDKADTSSPKVPTAQTLVAQSRSKASDDAPVDNDPDLLNLATTVSWVGWWTSFLSQKYWPDLGKLDGPVFVTPDADLAISVFSHEDVEGGFWMRSWLAFLVLLPLDNFWIFGPAHTRLSLSLLL